MTDTNQNLRQAEQALLKRYAELVNSGDAGNWYQEAELEVIAARQALALPTADHLPDAGKMINGLTQAETDASASVSGLTAAPVDELPELPEPTWSIGLGVAFTADQMRAYAREAMRKDKP